ncbi:MAG: YqeG family HAD IIIA-type phosphatase [Tindallia sp. MSAO_Bac2]|nr:MAG: YqeG family HAD IIIA-type phosphatase [Tindallia sp. MSAO_Bac2]
MNLLKPRIWVDQLSHIPIKELKTVGIKALIIDIDNTLVAWDSPQPSSESIQWMKEAKEEGFNIMLVSNNKPERVQRMQAFFHCRGLARAKKPTGYGLKKALRIMRHKPHETAIIGDQIFTDVLGGNRIGLYTILVTPIKSKEFWWTTIVRRAEKRILSRLKKFR